MPIPYYYEPDCFNLNREARLSNATIHRLLGLVQRAMPLNCPQRSRLNEHSEWDEALAYNILQKVYRVLEEIDWSQELDQASYAVFDTETTGLQPARDRIIELGCVLVEKGSLVEGNKFVELVNPQRSIPPTASYITGITDGMVSHKRQLPEVLHDFLEFVGSRVLVAHGAPFDLAFLNRAIGKLAPARIYNPVIDTCLLFRCLLPGLDNYTLEGLARMFKIGVKGRHTALGDSIMTAKLLLKIIDLLKKCHIKDLQELNQYLRIQKSFYHPDEA